MQRYKKNRPVRLTRCVTAKRSPLNNRVVRSTPGGDVCADIDPEGVAHLCRWGTLSECIRSVPTSAGPSDTAVIERRRFQRHFNRTGRIILEAPQEFLEAPQKFLEALEIKKLMSTLPTKELRQPAVE